MLAVGGRTNNEYMLALIDAQYIHKHTGVAILPWEADNIPNDWLEAIRAFYEDVPRKAEIINRGKGKK